MTARDAAPRFHTVGDGTGLTTEDTFTREELQMRLFLPMLLEATRAIEEKIVRNVRDVDFGLIFGLGFPPFRGGLLHWADTLGAESIVETLKPFEELGERYKPTPLLLEMAKDADCQTFNCTEGGILFGKGVRSMTLDKFLASH